MEGLEMDVVKEVTVLLLDCEEVQGLKRTLSNAGEGEDAVMM